MQIAAFSGKSALPRRPARRSMAARKARNQPPQRKDMTTLGIIQARMGSTRLPGKVLRRLGGRTVLDRVVRAARASGVLDDLVVATTIEAVDDAVEAECAAIGVHCHRGPVDDVLTRFLGVLDHARQRHGACGSPRTARCSTRADREGRPGLRGRRRRLPDHLDRPYPAPRAGRRDGPHAGAAGDRRARHRPPPHARDLVHLHPRRRLRRDRADPAARPVAPAADAGHRGRLEADRGDRRALRRRAGRACGRSPTGWPASPIWSC